MSHPTKSTLITTIKAHSRVHATRHSSNLIIKLPPLGSTQRRKIPCTTRAEKISASKFCSFDPRRRDLADGSGCIGVHDFGIQVLPSPMAGVRGGSAPFPFDPTQERKRDDLSRPATRENRGLRVEPWWSELRDHSDQGGWLGREVLTAS